ncbi:zinc finger CCCH domain-containing protein [Musa troglodytarum]|uniref:Zinc finger CCCH domain-containing protein n=1 Tax=Musa troglodytarum TaxID=320322 RepID=A0A9E7JMZ3_9LILI|nr:zinc finger CCCH domain-containing protein [Musa troglodytarum]
MFGFVTFVYPETMKLILAKGNPHFVYDAQVLVKPYKEKGKRSSTSVRSNNSRRLRGVTSLLVRLLLAWNPETNLTCNNLQQVCMV